MPPATERFEWQASPVSGQLRFRLEPPRCKKRKALDAPVCKAPVREKAQRSGGIREEAIECAASARELPGNAETTGKKDQTDFPIVGIGASAGGLEAFEQFFTNMPPDTGMAFVLIQHLDPNHKSILTDLIRRYTKMKVVEVRRRHEG